MDSFEIKNRLAEVLGNEKAQDFVAYIDARTGREYGEERASITVTLQEIMRRLDRLEIKTDTLQQGQVDLVKGQVDLVKGQVTLIRWMVGVGLTVIGLTVTLVKFL